MNHIVEVFGQTGSVTVAKFIESSADALHHFSRHIGCAGNGGMTANRVALTWDVDLEVDRRAGWVVTESTQEHPRFRNVFGLAEGA